jgi:hypothetical protein
VNSLSTASPETAYFWGYVAGDGTVSSDGLTLTAPDETVAERLAEIAGSGDGSDGGRGNIESETTEREYLHDTEITRTEESFEVHISGDFETVAEQFGVPVGEATDASYDFGDLEEFERPLLRGIVESAGTVCFKSSAGTVGLSFVHESRKLLQRVQELLDALPVATPTGDIDDASSGYWFGVDDDAVPEVAPEIYAGSDESDLYAPTRRRKLRRSLDQADVEVTASV